MEVGPVTSEEQQTRSSNGERRGTAAGVPYLAVPPPEGTDTPGIVAILHGMDPPRTEEAMAGALPLDGVRAWRVYLGLPMTGKRMPEGGSEEIMRLATEEPLMKLTAPVIEQAAAELPKAIEELRGQLGLDDDAKVGLVGSSAGAGAVLKALVDSEVRVEAVVLINPVARASSAIEAGERAFDMKYEWTEESRAKADELDFVTRVREIASRDGQPAILIIQGEDDDEAFLTGSEELQQALSKEYRKPDDVSLVKVRGLAHSLAAEPGIEKEPQNAAATFVDHEARGLLARHIV
jgi:dienelactone hydrolase